MYPGLAETDCRVAAFRYQQLRGAGQHQQLVAGARPAAGVRPVFMSLRQHAGALLVCAGQRLQGLQVVRESLETVAIGEPAAIG